MALEHFKTAQQRSGDLTTYQDYVAKSQKFLAEAQKDNDFIYHERVPDGKTLEPIGKAALAKISPLPERLSNSFKGTAFYSYSKM